MLYTQKETILSLLRLNEANKRYERKYWIAYKDFLDPTDGFTDFSCERLDGKQGYLELIESLLMLDSCARIFVEVYGLENDDDDTQYVYADTLIIISELSLSEIKQVFNGPNDIFPSDIGEVSDCSRQIFVVDDNGEMVSAESLFCDRHSVYYCWWD